MISEKPTDFAREIEQISRRLQALEKEKSALLARKAELESNQPDKIAVSTKLTTNDKISLFKKSFVGREDIYAFRWESKSQIEMNEIAQKINKLLNRKKF